MTGEFAILDKDGVVIRTVTCPADEAKNQVGPGERLHVGKAQPGDIVRNGKAYTPPHPAPAPISYSVARAAAYPPIQAQLDALWHAMDAGTIPKVEPMYSQIKQVKEAYPRGVDIGHELPPAGDLVPPTGEL